MAPVVHVQERRKARSMGMREGGAREGHQSALSSLGMLARWAGAVRGGSVNPLCASACAPVMTYCVPMLWPP